MTTGYKFNLFAIEHASSNWEAVRQKLSRTVKLGDKVGYEVSPRDIELMNPYLELIKKAKEGKTLEAKEKLELLFERLRADPILDFNFKLLFFLKTRGHKVVPLVPNRIAQVGRKQRELAKAAPLKSAKEAEKLKRQRARISALKEEKGLRATVAKEKPQIVIVGGKHKGSFVGMPHKTVLNDMPRLRALVGKKFLPGEHYLAIARSERRQKTINRLLNRAKNQKLSRRKK